MKNSFSILKDLQERHRHRFLFLFFCLCAVLYIFLVESCTNPVAQDEEESIICSLFTETYMPDQKKNFFDGKPLKVMARFCQPPTTFQWVVHGEGFKIRDYNTTLGNGQDSLTINGSGKILADTVEVYWIAFDSINRKDSLDRILGQRDSIEIFAQDSSGLFYRRSIEIFKRNTGPRIIGIFVNGVSVGLNRLDSLYPVAVEVSQKVQLKMIVEDLDSTDFLTYNWMVGDSLLGQKDTLLYTAPIQEQLTRLKVEARDNYDIEAHYYLEITSFKQVGSLWLMKQGEIVKYSSNGNFIKSIGGFIRPRYADINYKGQELWVADQDANKIVIIDLITDQIKTKINNIPNPTLISVYNNDNNFYAWVGVQEGGLENLWRVWKNDSTYVIDKQYSIDNGPHSDIKTFSRHWRTSKSFLYAADSNQLYNVYGTINNNFSRKASFAGLINIVSIAITDRNYSGKDPDVCWAVGEDNQTVAKYIFQGVNYSSNPTKIYKGFKPVGITYAPDDYSVWISDKSRNQLLKLPPFLPTDFTYVDTLMQIKNVYYFYDSSYIDSVLNSDTTLLNNADTLIKFDTLVSIAKNKIVVLKSADNLNFNDATPLSANREGDLWVMDKNNNRLLKFNRNGILLTRINGISATVPDFFIENQGD